MLNKKFISILSIIMIAGAMSACSLQGAKGPDAAAASATAYTVETNAADAGDQTLPLATDVSDAIEGDLLDQMAEPLAALLLVLGQNDYKPDTAVSNEQAVDYLCHMGRLFYSSRAEDYDALGTECKYIAFDETEIDQILDEAFNGRYSTTELLTQDTGIVYNAHTYYVPLEEGADALELICTGGNMSTNEYTFKIPGQGKEPTFTLTIVPSGNNTTGYSIESFVFD